MFLFLSGALLKPEMTYSDFVIQLENNNVESVFLEEDTANITLKTSIAIEDGKTSKDFRVAVSSTEQFEVFMREVIQRVVVTDAHPEGERAIQVKYSSKINNIPAWVAYIPYILLILVVVLVFFFVIGQNQSNAGKVMNFGKSRARLYTTSKITFKDVAGADEEKEEMIELVSFLKDPKRYNALGAKIPKGILLVGPPGTGKTYLAKAVAGEAGVPFFSISGSDFVEMYVGVGASRVRDLFEQAKKNTPCIIFIDEIDAVGRHRGSGLGGGHDEREQTLNQLLVEMDGFGVNEGIIIIAATNRPDILDPALTRPGRFDRKITVGYPDIKAREQILEIHAKNKPLDESVKLSEVAKITSGFTAADLANLLNEAALLAARDKKSAISYTDIKESTYRVIIGPEKKSRIRTTKDNRSTAIHEAGHAIAVKIASSVDKVDRISIIPAGFAGGYTSYRPEEDSYYITKSELQERIVIALGGKAAEEIALSEISTGASSDLKNANSIAYDMVVKYGMSNKLGNRVFVNESNEVYIGRDIGHAKNYSEETSSIIDEEVKTIIDECYDRVKEIINKNIDKLNIIADLLVEKEKIEGDEFELIMQA